MEPLPKTSSFRFVALGGERGFALLLHDKEDGLVTASMIGRSPERVFADHSYFVHDVDHGRKSEQKM